MTEPNFVYITNPRLVRALVDLLGDPRHEPDWDSLLANAPRHANSSREFKAACRVRAIEQWRRRRERQFGVGP